MTRILTSVVLLVLLYPALAVGAEVAMIELMERDDFHYKKFTDVPFTGKIIGRDGFDTKRVDPSKMEKRRYLGQLPRQRTVKF